MKNVVEYTYYTIKNLIDTHNIDAEGLFQYRPKKYIGG